MKTPGKRQLLLLSEKPSKGFCREIAGNIVRMMELTIPFVLIFLVYTMASLDTASDHGSLILHLIFTALSMLVLAAVMLCGKDIRRYAPHIVGISALYSMLSCLWAALYSCLSPGTTDNAIIYPVVLVAVAALSYLRPHHSMVLFFCCGVLFLALNLPKAASPITITRCIIYALVITGLALIISYTRYSTARAVYLTHRAAITKQREIEEMNRKLRILVHTDDLTGLYNRRFLDDFLPGIWDSAVNSAYPLAFLMLDIDDFKRLNDCEGHQAGDRCIEQLAGVLTRTTDATRDYVLRYGGEEFVVVMQGVTPEQAMRTAEDIRGAVEALAIPNRGSMLSTIVTVSVGVYHAVPAGSCSSACQQFFSRSDEAMYEAKRTGKNRVVFYRPSPDHPESGTVCRIND